MKNKVGEEPNIKLFRLALILLLMLNIGCAAALVGGLLYKSSKSKEAKQQFMSEFNKTNLEREKAGLAPLDICTEKYYFDEGWAKEDSACKARIERYEAGDSKALGNQELVIEKSNTETTQQ